MTGPVKPSEQEIREFVAKHRNLGGTLADVLSKIAPEITEIMDTGIGWQLIKQDVERARDLAYKVLNLTASDEEKAECKYLIFHRLPSVAKTIDTWLQAVGLIRKGNGTGTGE